MRHIFNQFIIKIAEYLPLIVVRQVAGKYVAGETADDALKVIENINSKGYSATLDILGEHTKDKNEAKSITEEYQILLTKIHDQNLDCNISIKLSHLGIDISKDYMLDNMNLLIETARKNNHFIRIDMEGSKLTNTTIEFYNNIKDKYDNIGIALQAYLYRTQKDIEQLKNIDGINIRICKGIYREPENIAFQGRDDINTNFLKLLRFALENDIYVGIATHDLYLLEKIYIIIHELKIPAQKFEFQVLYGVPMSGWLEKHIDHGYRVRVYVPYGKKWYDYSIRRLKENPAIANYIIKNIFRR